MIKLIKHWLVQEFNGKSGAPDSGSVEVDKKKTKVMHKNDLCIGVG